MNTHTLTQAKFALLVLSLFHIGIIASSNYLVQLPVTILGMHTTWGAFTFPFIFLATDLTVRIFGAALARKIIFVVMLPALVISYLLSVLFFNGEYQGLAGLAEFNAFVGRIALASFLAYCLGQLLDISVFNRMRQWPQWWVAPLASTVLGNLLDTLIFFFVAFYQSSDAFMAAHWFEIALADYGFKLLISVLVFLPFYGVILTKLQKYLLKSERLCDQDKAKAVEVLAR
ncbi:7-cyano-7-deazaguanine/7-aminomethyl-7-deazaguanine transporter [Motilimonas eburnea]|uniref:7-cyano-7-deazaguanine/7-aminomethyl-7- deazaguanine transporter n=1 Tax=Motilimonas eburnea TaxID=1737488 RepID=UPI001E47B084|nr:7-cyano-7-deazaguanine/7-aminomethyl-7-deazaguanine transporter [Motilimonas eburnea]MCE2572945.1 7-cyano-7-deazaguanine/7-aminomethyl-7-deazaguanine transporter [Motilimonas eburnea]